MITVIKLSPRKEPKIQYQGEVVERLSHGVIIQAYWSHPPKNLGYITFEPGDRFIEYYYTDHWFNIFDIAGADGQRKGWYCNITEPAVIYEDHIEQVDLLLDVWITPTGKVLLLDEDEFASDTTLNAEQRKGAQQGLQDLLKMLAARQEAFSEVEQQNNTECVDTTL